jgi:hypothetical protein
MALALAAVLFICDRMEIGILPFAHFFTNLHVKSVIEDKIIGILPFIFEIFECGIQAKW